VPYRGKRNEPAYVVEVAKAIARIRSSEDESIVMEVLITNAKDLFKIDI
jgi:Tat protein secretion system quality control protein TatD with DNase activity